MMHSVLLRSECHEEFDDELAFRLLTGLSIVLASFAGPFSVFLYPGKFEPFVNVILFFDFRSDFSAIGSG